jgi:hypothetical protein
MMLKPLRPAAASEVVPSERTTKPAVIGEPVSTSLPPSL